MKMHTSHVGQMQIKLYDRTNAQNSKDGQMTGNENDVLREETIDANTYDATSSNAIKGKETGDDVNLYDVTSNEVNVYDGTNTTHDIGLVDTIDNDNTTLVSNEYSYSSDYNKACAAGIKQSN